MDWFRPGRSRKEALKRKVDTSDIRKLRELLLKGRSRSDIGREVFEDLGFSLNFWSGAAKGEVEASVDIHCGCYNERLGNNVLVDLPHSSENLEWLRNAQTLLRLVAEIWRPRWAGIMSKKAMRERDYNAQYPFVDWMVYVPRLVEAVPPPSRIEPVEGLGSIIIVQPEPTTGDDAEELLRIRRVESILST